YFSPRLTAADGYKSLPCRFAKPHQSPEGSPQTQRFRGFFITLAHPVQVNNEPVSHVLIACAAADARHELKIFSYLASVLYRHPAETIMGLTGYEAFIALLRQ
ncbi:PTS transporter subunit EIIA, partial [Salmonella enterica]|nr:PTS transporter subunit EIIA [Salmonella enterica]